MIAVRLYGAGNREGLPADWPAETREIKRAEDAPHGWLVMADRAELRAYKDERRAEYDAAIAQRDDGPEPSPMQKRLASIEARLDALEGRRG